MGTAQLKVVASQHSHRRAYLLVCRLGSCQKRSDDSRRAVYEASSDRSSTFSPPWIARLRVLYNPELLRLVR